MTELTNQQKGAWHYIVILYILKVQKTSLSSLPLSYLVNTVNL